MEKILNKKAIIIMSLILVEITSMFLMYKSLSTKKSEIDNVALSDNIFIKNNDMFALMIEQDDGTYKGSNESTLSSEGYVFNEALSGCIDMNGKTIDNALSFNGNKVTLT